MSRCPGLTAWAEAARLSLMDSLPLTADPAGSEAIQPAHDAEAGPCQPRGEEYRRETARRRAATEKRAGRDDAEAEEWDTLASALNDWGILHVAPLRRRRERIAPEDLFWRLAEATDVRLREAAVLVLLTYPGQAPDAQAAMARLGGLARERAVFRYVAAAALQRMWRTRLQTDLGPHPLIPPAYLDELGLPPLEEDFGRPTLLALARIEEARFGHNAWAGYTSLMDLFLAEIRLTGWGRRRARAG